MKTISQLLLLFIAASLFSCKQNPPEFSWKLLTVHPDKVSFRGLSVVNDEVLWLNGSKSTVGRSVDGGEHWNFYTINDCPDCELRDIHAFDQDRAVLMVSGQPARMYYTSNGGEDWTISYHNPDTLLFFDSMDFYDDRNGIAFSDPRNGKFVLIKTTDGGLSWQDVPVEHCPDAVEGEAGFAASGTVIQYVETGEVLIATGGVKARIIKGNPLTGQWRYYDTPLSRPEASSGIFSLWAQEKEWIMVGGDYRRDSVRAFTSAISKNEGAGYETVGEVPWGYRSCIEQLYDDVFICCGPTGCDISMDRGKSWEPFSKQGFHVCQKAREGKSFFAAGSDGRIAVLKTDTAD